MKIRRLQVSAATFPLLSPFRTSLGRKNSTKNVLCRIECERGVAGFGEGSGSLAMPEATQPAMLKVLRSLRRRVEGRFLPDWRQICEEAKLDHPLHPTAVSALECALLDAYCRSRRMPIRRFFGSRRAPIETFYTLSALNLEATVESARRLWKRGFRKFKLKVTREAPSAELEKMERIAAMGRGIEIIADANQGWTASQAIKFISRIAGKNLPVRLIEQPVLRTDLVGLARVKKGSPIPVAADESLRSMEDLEEMLERDAADVYNIKIAKLGLLESLRAARRVRSAGKKLMIGCMMESARGLAVSVSWAIGSGIFDFVDLDSFLLMRPQRQRPPFRHRGPWLFPEDSR